MSNQQRRNRILLDLIPNSYYTQLPEAERDAPLPEIRLAPMQIKKVEIYKSYQQHVTDVTIEVDNIDSHVLTQWSEGKYLAKLDIAPDVDSDTQSNVSNFFACSNLERIHVEQQYAVFGEATSSAIVTLKSVTRKRLELENNFTFELGGKNGKGASGVGVPPLDFLHNTFMKLYNRNYMDEGFETSVPWNTEYCDFQDKTHQVFTSPPNGYRMITDTNMQTLEYFFEHYPLFNTPYGWVLDDFNSDGTTPTTVRISDFAWWRAWESGIEESLSNILSIEVPDSPDGEVNASQEFKSASAIRYFEVQKIDHLSYFDWVEFYTVDGFPKIWAVDVSSGKPIPMNGWNTIHEKAMVLTPLGNVKYIPNPMYKEYLTFMTPKEIEESQLHINMFQELHPVLEKYSFSNLYIGEVDLHTVVEFKAESTSKYEPLDRLGMGHQVLHTYYRDNLVPKEFKSAVGFAKDEKPEDSQFTYSYTLNTEIIFLAIDKGDLTIERSGNEDASRVTPVTDGIPDKDYQPELCVDESGAVVPRAGGDTPGGTDGVGIPGNSSIADQGEAMFNRGFKYVWGGKRSAASGLDCSGFTNLAVTRSGITSFPHGTANQRPWCQRNADKIQGTQNAKRGDILFFNWGNGRSFGHTGIAIGGGQFIHSSGGRSGGVGAKKNSFAGYHPKNTEIYRLKDK